MKRALALILLLGGLLPLPASAGNAAVRFTVRFADGTPLGSFDAELCQELSPACLGVAPETVENFLGYVDREDYRDSIVHRSIVATLEFLDEDFVIQGGGFWFDADAQLIRRIFEGPVVTNQFNQSNRRGTLAMARTSAVNSATNQWYVNLRDNGGPCPGDEEQMGLDCTNEGFTVFGVIPEAEMEILNAIAALLPWDLSPLYFDPIYEDVTCNETVCMPLEFEFTPLAASFEPPADTPQDVLPHLVLIDVTRVPEPAQGLSALAAASVLLALRRRRIR